MSGAGSQGAHGTDGGGEVVEGVVVEGAGDASEAADADVVGGDDASSVDAVEPVPVDPMAALQGELDEARARLRAVSKAFTEQKDEMASFRDRVEGQAKVARQRREFEVVKTFFEPVQNLRRSVGAAGDGPLADGLRMVLKQFEDGLTKLGLEPIPGVGATFDPNLHEALSVIPVVDDAQHNAILFVHQEGFMVDGRPVAPAQVVVGRKEGPA